MEENLEFIEDVRARLRVGRVNRLAGAPVDLRDGESLEPLGRGAAVVVDDDWPAWKRRHVVHIARILWQASVTPDAIVVLESAAVLWGLPTLHPGEAIHVTRTAARHRSAHAFVPGNEEHGDPVVVRHAISLADDEWTVLAGVRVCTLDRLVYDVARLRRPRVALPLIDGVLARLAHADRRDRRGTTERAAPIKEAWVRRAEETRAIRGIRRARAILPHADALSEAIGESSTRWACLALGLPEPVCQFEIPLGDGTSYFPDLYIEELNLIIEFDGAVKFEGPDGPARRAAHLRRHDRLVAMGYTVIHLTWDDILTVANLAEALMRHLGPEVMARFDARLELLEPGMLS